MAIPEGSKVPSHQLDDVKQMIRSKLEYARRFWYPLHMRMDYWSMMYHLQDPIQFMKPTGYRRFISNEPRTAVDLAQSILTRNEAYWKIALFEQADQNKDERDMIGRVERTLNGIIHDVDEQFTMRLRPRFWKDAAFQALLRGFIWAKVHITKDALKYRDTPIVAEMYDPRLVYPDIDDFGLNSVVFESITTLGALVSRYPDKFEDYAKKPNYDPYTVVTKLEYWSNDRGEKKGINAVMVSVGMTDASYSHYNYTYGALPTTAEEWVIEPYYHGYTPDALPVVGVPVNGIHTNYKPNLSNVITERLSQKVELYNGATPYNWWTGENSYIADVGRSILSSVEDHVPQFNEMVATIMQHLALTAYGTWVFHTPTGEIPKFTPGIEGKVALTPQESIDRIEMQPISQDAFRLLEILGDEKQNGTISNILKAHDTSGGDMSGFMHQQMAHAAMNSLEPFVDGLEEFGQAVGRSILKQLQLAGSEIQPFELLAPSTSRAGNRQSLWVVEFDPKELAQSKRRLRPRPVFKPSLPDDLVMRINAAKLALDPRRPILSLTYVLENILQIEDPTQEIDRIWEDMANQDPAIVPTQLAAALRRLGEEDLAQAIEEPEFQKGMTNEIAQRQGLEGAGLPGGPPPEGGPPMPPEFEEEMGGPPTMAGGFQPEMADIMGGGMPNPQPAMMPELGMQGEQRGI